MNKTKIIAWAKAAGIRAVKTVAQTADKKVQDMLDKLTAAGAAMM